MRLPPRRLSLVLALLVSAATSAGCYERHGGAASPSFDGGVDAGLDAGAPRSCVPSGSTIQVTARDEPGSFCERGDFVGYIERTYTEGELMLIDLCIGESCGCRISVSGLSPEVREALLGVMESVFDAYFEFGPQHLLVRNTSLCDGPDPDECPIVIDARTGGLQPEPELFRVGVRFGATECTGECGGVRELDFELPLGHRTDRVSVGQGEIGNQGASHFANLRSWNGCTDEPDTVTWVHWIE